MRLFANLFTVVVLVFLGVTSVSAQTATFMESGTDATQTIAFYASSIGTVTSATDWSATGPRSVKFDVTGTPAAAQVTTPAGVLGDAGRRPCVRRRFDTLPTGDDVIFTIQTSAVLGVFNIRLTSGGLLKIVLANGTTLVTGSKVLAVNVPYRICFPYTVTSTSVYTVKVLINGVLDSSVVNGTALARTGTDRLVLGMSTTNSANAHAWIDDLYIDNGSTLDDPGDIHVTAKRPFANGTANGFTTQIGSGPAPNGIGSGHAPNVSEEPLSQSFGWSFLTALATVTEEYNIENPAAGDLSVSLPGLKGVMGWIFAGSALSETGKILVQNVTSNISLTSTPAFFFAIGSNTYPAGVGSDIGMQTDSSSTTTVSLYECGIVVAYVQTGNFFRLIR